LYTTNAVTVVDSKISNLVIQGFEETAAFQLNEALIMDEIVHVSASIPTQKLVSLYAHLKDIVFSRTRGTKGGATTWQ